MWPSLGETALRLGDEEATYGELLVIGSAIGLLDEARLDTSHAIRVLMEHPSAIGDDELRREAEAFRRQRRLHSGDDLRTWLERRGIDQTQWTGHLRRSIGLHSRLEARADAVDDDEVEQALVVDLACGGWWEHVAEEAVRLWSAARVSPHREPQEEDSQGADRGGATDVSFEANAKRIAENLPSLGVLDPDWCADRMRVFESRRRALAAVVAACSEHEVVARRINEHAVDWTEFVYDEIRLPNRVSANEALLCAREDGLSPGEVAARARVDLDRRELRRDQVSSGIAAMLTGAVSGDILGPFDEDDGVHVVWLQDRRLASVDDPDTREAAISELVSERLDRAAAGKALVVGVL